VQEVTRKDGEIRLVYTVHSSGWVSTFFPIDDRTESLLSPGSGSEPFGIPVLFREKLNEGKTHTWKEARVDLATLQVHTRDLLKKTEKSDPISAKTFDTLSCIYYLRTRPLVAGEPIRFDIYDFKRLWNAEVRVVKREGISTPVGRFKTVQLQALLNSEGVKPRADYMTVWLSDDALRIPVQITVKLKVGEFTATLAGGSHWK
jgi:hypothetical protein